MVNPTIVTNTFNVNVVNILCKKDCYRGWKNKLQLYAAQKTHTSDFKTWVDCKKKDGKRYIMKIINCGRAGVAMLSPFQHI